MSGGRFGSNEKWYCILVIMISFTTVGQGYTGVVCSLARLLVRSRLRIKCRLCSPVGIIIAGFETG